MSGSLTGHSRLVFWLKITLPILALAILSTLFLLARRIDYEGQLPYVRERIDARANDPRLTRPDYGGMTSDGAQVSVTAAEARPGKDADSPATATDVVAEYRIANGRTIRASGSFGRFDTANGIVYLEGAARMVTADGYDLNADRMRADVRSVNLAADGNVAGNMPLGRITADSMALTGPEGQHHLVFKDHVRLVYSPQN